MAVNRAIFRYAGHRVAEKRNDGSRQRFSCVFENGVLLVHLLGHFWDMLYHVKGLDTVSDKLAMRWFIFSPTIGRLETDRNGL